MAALTPAQFRTTLERLGISQAGVARTLGINRRTVTRYLSGGLEVTPMVAWALKGLEAETRRIREDA